MVIFKVLKNWAEAATLATRDRRRFLTAGLATFGYPRQALR
jgi:hypothetical protein